MMVIEAEAHVPPGGAFVARHPVSGVVFRTHTVDGLWHKYNEHCRANGYAQIGRQEMVENICANTKANICIEVDENMRPTLAQRIASFAHDMAHWASAGFPASKAAVEARQPICEKCPYWRGETGGQFFAVACAKCGCTSLKLAIHTTKCPDKRWGPFTP